MFVCRVDNIYLSWTLEYQIRLLLTQMWCYQPPQSVEQPILPPLARLSFQGVSALFAIVLTWVTLTPNGAKTENFGELERIITSVSKGNNGRQTSLKRWNNGNPVEMRHSEKRSQKWNTLDWVCTGWKEITRTSIGLQRYSATSQSSRGFVFDPGIKCRVYYCPVHITWLQCPKIKFGQGVRVENLVSKSGVRVEN